METEIETEFQRLPGLYRLWDLQFVFTETDDYQIHYAELTEDGAALFAVYRRAKAGPVCCTTVCPK